MSLNLEALLQNSKQYVVTGPSLDPALQLARDIFSGKPIAGRAAPHSSLQEAGETLSGMDPPAVCPAAKRPIPAANESLVTGDTSLVEGVGR